MLICLTKETGVENTDSDFLPLVLGDDKCTAILSSSTAISSSGTAISSPRTAISSSGPAISS